MPPVFSAKLGCTLDARCAKPLAGMAQLLRAEPSARVLEEVRKLFLSGQALPSFEQLRRFGLLYELFPLLQGWLESDPQAEAFLCEALRETDLRLREGSHASLMFLMCVFFWGPVSKELGLGNSAGNPPRHDQIIDAFQKVLGDAKFGVRPTRKMMADMEEVLARQATLQSNSPKRVGQVLSHPLFRSAYRLLALRQRLGEVDEECVGYWQKRAGSAPSRSWSKRGDSAADRGQRGGSRPNGK